MPDEKLFSCPVFLSLGARLFEEIARFADRKHLHAVAILDDVPARPDRDVMLAGRIGIKAARGYFRWRRNAGRNNGRGSRVAEQDRRPAIGIPDKKPRTRDP